MPILYSAVVFEKHILAEFGCCDGNFLDIVQQFISKIPWRNEKITYFHGLYLIHYILDKNYLYFCITNKTCQRSRAFLFLNEIHRQFLADSKEFTKVLAAEMYRYSEDYSTITIRKGEIDEINKIEVESSENILGETVILVNNPEKISYATVSYVGKSPGSISISVEKSRLYVMILEVLVIFFVIGAVYTFGPMSCVAIIGVTLCYIVRCISKYGKKSD